MMTTKNLLWATGAAFIFAAVVVASFTAALGKDISIAEPRISTLAEKELRKKYAWEESDQNDSKGKSFRTITTASEEFLVARIFTLVVDPKTVDDKPTITKTLQYGFVKKKPPKATLPTADAQPKCQMCHGGGPTPGGGGGRRNGGDSGSGSGGGDSSSGGGDSSSGGGNSSTGAGDASSSSGGDSAGGATTTGGAKKSGGEQQKIPGQNGVQPFSPGEIDEINPELYEWTQPLRTVELGVYAVGLSGDPKKPEWCYLIPVQSDPDEPTLTLRVSLRKGKKK